MPSLIPSSTDIPTLYTDDEAERFAAQLADLSQETLQPGTHPDAILNALGVDTSRLTVVSTYIGDCLNFTVYALSPSYEMMVDDNACYGPRVVIDTKGAWPR